MSGAQAAACIHLDGFVCSALLACNVSGSCKVVQCDLWLWRVTLQQRLPQQDVDFALEDSNLVTDTMRECQNQGMMGIRSSTL